jgi:hypothetical protein
MRKALLPMLVSLALCGAATTAMVMSSARAEPGPHKPLMVAATGMQLAANDPQSRDMPGEGDRSKRLQQMCTDRYARQTAQLTYLETSLQLTAAEHPLFERWKDAKLAIAHRHADTCAQRPVSQRQNARRDASAGQQRNAQDRVRPSPADRMAREEEFLKQRLADLDTERPALEAFYNALSPSQKMEMTRASMQERGGRDMGGMMHRHMFADARGPRRFMEGRPMDGGPMRDGSMQDGSMREGPMGPPPAPPPER